MDTIVTAIIPHRSSGNWTGQYHQWELGFTTGLRCAGKIDVVGRNRPVIVLGLGRPDNESWLYIRDDEGVEGYVGTSRIDWGGDLSQLEVIENP